MSIRHKQAYRQKEAPVNNKAKGSLPPQVTGPEEDQARVPLAAPCGHGQEPVRCSLGRASPLHCWQGDEPMRPI